MVVVMLLTLIVTTTVDLKYVIQCKKKINKKIQVELVCLFNFNQESLPSKTKPKPTILLLPT